MLSNDEQERSGQKAVRIDEFDYTPLKSREADYGPSSTEGGVWRGRGLCSHFVYSDSQNNKS